MNRIPDKTITAMRDLEFERIVAYLDATAEPTPCCAKCRRGTKAMLGPCGYELRCPRGCHDPAPRHARRR